MIFEQSVFGLWFILAKKLYTWNRACAKLGEINGFGETEGDMGQRAQNWDGSG